MVKNIFKFNHELEEIYAPNLEYMEHIENNLWYLNIKKLVKKV